MNWRGLLARAGLSLLSLVGFLGLVEGGAWLGEYLAYGTVIVDGRPHGLYATGRGRPRLQPGAELDGWLYEIHVNSLGFRGPEPLAEKPANGLRIWVVGGSTSFDIYARDDASTWPARMGALLAQALPDRTVEVINAGVPGDTLGGSAQALSESGRQLRPDYVVVYHGPNDLRAQLGPMMVRPSNLDRSATWRLLQRNRPQRATVPEDQVNHGLPKGIAGIQGMVDEVVEATLQVGAVPVFATHALRASPGVQGEQAREQVAETAVLLGLSAADTIRAFDGYNAQIAHYASSNGYPLAHVAEAVSADPENWGDATHFAAAGSALAAAEVARTIRADLDTRGR